MACTAKHFDLRLFDLSDGLTADSDLDLLENHILPY